MNTRNSSLFWEVPEPVTNFKNWKIYFKDSTYLRNKSKLLYIIVNVEFLWKTNHLHT